jgi:hypothetical protein
MADIICTRKTEKMRPSEKGQIGEKQERLHA